MLGDKHLDPNEEVYRQREKALNAVAVNRVPGQDDLEQMERADGPRMGWRELIRRILICNPAIQVKEGSEGSVALYLRKKQSEYTSDDYMLLHQPSIAATMNIPTPKSDFFIHHKYVTGFPKKPLAEYSCVTLDSSHLPVREHRGWRSVLLNLIRTHSITYAAALEEFGSPESDRRSNLWFEQTRRHR